MTVGNGAKVINVTSENADGIIVIKGDYENPSDGDLILIVEDDKTIIKKYNSSVGEWVATSFSAGPSSYAVGFQVVIGDTGNILAYRLNRNPEEFRISPYYTFDEDGEVDNVRIPILTGTAKATIENNDGTTDHPAVLTGDEYKLSTTNVMSKNFLAWRQAFKVGDTAPTEPVRYRLFIASDDSDDSKLLSEIYLPVSLWSGKSAGDEIEFYLTYEDIKDQTERLDTETYYTVYDSDAQFSLYGDGSEIYDKINGQEFIYYKILKENDYALVKTAYENNSNTNAFTDAEKTKLGSLTGGRHLGVFANLAALQTAYPTGVAGDIATVTDPSGNIFYWNTDTDSWADSGTCNGGDVFKAIIDPTGVNGDAYTMDNMAESATKKIFTADERTKLTGIAENAEVNVQSDYDETDTNDDAYIKNKPVFGTEFEVFESMAESTSSWSWTNKIDATTAEKPAGKYRIGFSCEVAQVDYSQETRFLVDGSAIHNHTTGNDELEPPLNSQNWVTLSGVYYKTLASAATIDLNIQHKDSGAGRMSNAVIEIWRVE